jgi:hypothetical protein
MLHVEGVCDNYLYTKSDGSLKCGSFLEFGLLIATAAAQCAQVFHNFNPLKATFQRNAIIV